MLLFFLYPRCFRFFFLDPFINGRHDERLFPVGEIEEFRRPPMKLVEDVVGIIRLTVALLD